MKIYGYARVSSQEQHLDRQLEQLKQYVSEESILCDKASGKNLERPAYQALKGALGVREGDTLVITSIDRLSRNKEDIKQELQWFKEHKIRLMILDLPTSMIEVPRGQEWILEMITNILIEVLASMSEQERLLIRKRQQEGILAAKKRGKHLGRPRLKMPEQFPMVYSRWESGEITAKAAMKEVGMASTSFYKMVKEYESERKSQCIFEDVRKVKRDVFEEN